MNTLNVVLSSHQIAGVPDYLNHYFFLDPVYGTNFTYPNTANGSFFNATTGAFVYPLTANGGLIFPWGYAVQNTYAHINLGILKGPYTLTFVPSAIDSTYFTTTKIIYDFGDGETTIIEKDIVIDYATATLANYAVSGFYAPGAEIGNPTSIYVPHVYYPLNNTITTYTPTITVVNGNSVFNIFTVTFSAVPLSYYDLDDISLLNKTGLSNNVYNNMMVMEVANPAYVANLKLLATPATVTSTVTSEIVPVFSESLPTPVQGFRAAASLQGLVATPEQFGAVGDGVHDDAPAIQAAIDYCTLNSIPALVFSAKTYFLSAFAGAKYSAAFPYAKQYAGYNNNFYVAPKLSVGYWPDAPTRRANITLLGTTGTVLCASNINTQKAWNGSSYTIIPNQTMITVRDQTSTCRLQNITLLWDGILTGELGANATVGLEVAGNEGGSLWGTPTYPYIKRDLIDVNNCTFINCHRAINMGTALVPGSGTQVANIKNSRFLYPKGSDSTSYAGGSEIVFIANDTYEVNVMDNFVEGSTYMPVRSPNGLPLDGFIFFTGIKSNIYRNTMTRMAVESLYLGCNSQGWYMGGAGSYDYIMPAVGGSITVQLPGVTTNAYETTKFNNLTSCAEVGLTVGQYVGINWAGGGDDGRDGGIYQINSYSKATNPYSCTMTRVSGINGGGAWANHNTMAAGQHLSGANRFIKPYDSHLRMGAHSEVIDNVFEMSLASVSAAGARGGTWMSHNPCIRADGGNHHVQGNKFSGTSMVYANCDINDVHSNWLIEDNDFYYYNQDPQYPRRTDSLWPPSAVPAYANTGINCSLSAGLIQNNRYHMWTDMNQNTVNHVTSAMPQIYVNCGDDLVPYDAAKGHTPVTFRTQEINYGTLLYVSPVYTAQAKNIHRNNHTYVSVPSAMSYVTDKQGQQSTDDAACTGNVLHGFDSVARLRTYGTVNTNAGPYYDTTYFLYNGLRAVVTNIGEYIYNSSSMAVDDGVIVIKPNAINIANPGRWIASS